MRVGTDFANNTCYCFSVLVTTRQDLQVESVISGPKGHINIRISHSGSKAQYEGIPEIMVCRILVFMWSLGPQVMTCLPGGRCKDCQMLL